jgi:hypothetical protein
MLTKTIQLENFSINLLNADDTTWVSVKSLSEFLGLDYEEEVRDLVVNTSMSALGQDSRVLPHAKVMQTPDGKKELWIPLDNVSLYASKVQLKDLSKLGRQRTCMTKLPNLMANAF